MPRKCRNVKCSVTGRIRSYREDFRMEITEASAKASRRGQKDYFSGTVWIDEIAACGPPSRLSILRVTFEPGARTAWHTHPISQELHRLSGIGRGEQQGEPAQVLQ